MSTAPAHPALALAAPPPGGVGPGGRAAEDAATEDEWGDDVQTLPPIDDEPAGEPDAAARGEETGSDAAGQSTMDRVASDWVQNARQTLGRTRRTLEDRERELDEADASDDVSQLLGGAREWVKQPSWPDRDDLINYCRDMETVPAVVLLIAGVVYSVMGYGVFKVLAIANIAAIGAWLGYFIGKPLEAGIPGMIICGVIAAAVAWPLFRYALAFSGGIIGFMVGVAVWRALGMADLYAPAGGLIGGVFLFMLSFILFEFSIMAMAAIQGTIMLLLGLGGLLLKYPEIDEPATAYLEDFPVILPVLLLSLSIASVFYQQYSKRVKEEEAKK